MTQSKESKDIKRFNQRLSDIRKQFGDNTVLEGQYRGVIGSLGLDVNENGNVKNNVRNHILIDENELSNLMEQLPTVGSFKKELKKEGIVTQEDIESELERMKEIYSWLDKYKGTYAYEIARTTGAISEGNNLRNLTRREIYQMIEDLDIVENIYNENPFLDFDIEEIKERKKQKRSKYGKITRQRKRKQKEKLKSRGFKYK